VPAAAAAAVAADGADLGVDVLQPIWRAAFCGARTERADFFFRTFPPPATLACAGEKKSAHKKKALETRRALLLIGPAVGGTRINAEFHHD